MTGHDHVPLFPDNCPNPYLFRATLIKLVEALVLEYKKLTAA